MKNKIIANPFLQKLNYILSKKQIISLFNLFISNKISLETSIEPETSSSLKRDIIIKRNDHYPLFKFWNYSNYQTRFFNKMVAKEFENRFFFLNIICRTCGMRYLRRIPYASEHETGIKGGLETRGWGPEDCSSRPR